MKHRIFGKKLNRNTKQRKALFKSLLHALIIHEKVQTTVARARAIRRLVERIVTLAKDGSVAASRQIAAIVNRKESIEKLNKVIVPRFKNKIGGYIRMIRIDKRKGDNAERVILQWSETGEERKSKSEKIPDKRQEKKEIKIQKKQ